MTKMTTFETDHRNGYHNGAPAPASCSLCRELERETKQEGATSMGEIENEGREQYEAWQRETMTEDEILAAAAKAAPQVEAAAQAIAKERVDEQDAKLLESLRHELKTYETRYETAKVEFLERATTNPAYAIKWGSSMAIAQGEYEAAYDLIGRGDELGTEDVREHVERLERQVRRSHGTSTSGLSNAVEYHAWEGTVSVLERLEGWLSYRDSKGGG